MKKETILSLISEAINEALQVQLYLVKYKIFKHGDFVSELTNQFSVKSESEIPSKIKELHAHQGMLEPEYKFVILQKKKLQGDSIQSVNESELEPVKNKLNTFLFKPGEEKRIKINFDFVSASDKRNKKAVEQIMKQFPFIHHIDNSMLDELEIVRQEIQRGRLRNDNMFLYPTIVDDKTIYHATRDANLAKTNSLKLKK